MVTVGGVKITRARLAAVRSAALRLFPSGKIPKSGPARAEIIRVLRREEATMQAYEEDLNSLLQKYDRLSRGDFSKLIDFIANLRFGAEDKNWAQLYKVPVLVTALGHQSQEARQEAMRAIAAVFKRDKLVESVPLWQRAVELALPALAKYVSDGDESVRMSVREALSNIGTFQAIELLLGPRETSLWGRFLGHFEASALDAPEKTLDPCAEADDVYGVSNFSDTTAVLDSIPALPQRVKSGLAGGRGLVIGFGDNQKEIDVIRSYFGLRHVDGIDRDPSRAIRAVPMVSLLYDFNVIHPADFWRGSLASDGQPKYTIHHLSSSQLSAVFPPDTFDVIYTAGTDVYWGGYRRLIELLRPGGIFIGPGLSTKSDAFGGAEAQVSILDESPVVFVKKNTL